MALPTVTDLKAVCRIQSTAEDTLLAAYLAQAQALTEAHMGRPIAAVSRTFTDEACNAVAYGVTTQLLIPVTPVDLTTVAIEDADGTVLSETDDYRPGDAWSGSVRARPGVAFNNPPYTITCDVGLDTASDYSTRIEPVVSLAILDIAADLWFRRNPGAQNEASGGGVSTSYFQEGMVARALSSLEPFRMVRVA